MIGVSIIGGSGYTGGELLRILSNHPKIEIECITSRRLDGVPVTKVHRNLRGIEPLEGLTFKNIPPEDIDSDVVFCATPHGVSMKIVPILYERDVRIIDLSGDYRFEDIEIYERWYGIKHTGKLDAIYGLPEIHRTSIKRGKLIANPGCFPTGAILLLAPLIKEGIVEERIVIDSKTGVSGAGITPTDTTHFPNVNENVVPYKVTSHRHTPEIEKELRKLSDDVDIEIFFTPHLVPITRGILTTAHVFLHEEMDSETLIDIYRRFYRGEPFIRILEESMPSLTGVRGTNFCDITLEVDRDRRVVLISAIDNLVKGASGQGVQNMNIMMGFDEREGLWFGGLAP